MIVSAVLLLFVCTSALVIAQMPGGWRKANPDDDNVVKAATFAVNTKFPDQKVEFTVREAMTQVGKWLLCWIEVLKFFVFYFILVHYPLGSSRDQLRSTRWCYSSRIGLWSKSFQSLRSIWWLFSHTKWSYPYWMSTQIGRYLGIICILVAATSGTNIEGIIQPTNIQMFKFATNDKISFNNINIMN